MKLPIIIGMEASVATLERILHSVSALVCGAIALAAWMVLDIVPSQHRWVAEVIIWLFGLVAAAKLGETIMRGAAHWFRRRAAVQRRKERDAAALAETEEMRRADEEKRAAILRRLSYLSQYELELFNDAIQKRQQTVLAPITSPVPTGLVHKGLLQPYRGTQLTYSNLPWLIPDFVWEELLGREAEMAERCREATKAADRENRYGR